MLNIIRQGYKDILGLFITSNEPLHLRDIAKRAHLNENSTHRFLGMLEENNILASVKKGNMKLFWLRNNVQAHLIRTFFTLQTYEQLPLLRRTALEHYFEQLPSPPVYAVLFGSTAKNMYKKTSDIDLLLITHTRRIQDKQAIQSAQAQTGLLISTFQLTYKQFKKELLLKEDFVVQSALRTGYPLTNHLRFYEETNNEPLRAQQVPQQPSTPRRKY